MFKKKEDLCKVSQKIAKSEFESGQSESKVCPPMCYTA